MVEEKVNPEFLAADFKRVLTADKGEPDAQLEEKLPDVLKETGSRSRLCASFESVRKSKLYGSLRSCCARSDCGGGRVWPKFVSTFP